MMCSTYMKHTQQHIKKQQTHSSPALSVSVIAIATAGAMSLSLFTSFLVMLGILGYYRLQPHYLSETKPAVRAYVRAAVHASPDEDKGSTKTTQQTVQKTVAGRYCRDEGLAPTIRLANHVQEFSRSNRYSFGNARRAETMRPLLALSLGANSGDGLFRLAAAAFPAPGKRVAECPWLCDLIFEIAAQHGIPESALSLELIRPSITQRKIITRITAFLSDMQTPEILLEAVKRALQGTGITTKKSVLSDQRTLVQAFFKNNICLELLCITPGEQPGALYSPEVLQSPSGSGGTAPGEADLAAKNMAQEDYNEYPLPEDEDRLFPEELSDLSAVENTAEDGTETEVQEDQVPITGYVAIILDDGGYGGNELERVLNLDNRLTLAILPDTPFARETAERGTENGFEIMLHMPMQAGNGTRNRFPGEIKVCMTKEQIQKRSRECIAQFPEALGANNHTGGLYTTNEEKMGWFLEVVKEEGMYFVDSRTVGSSCAYDKAIELGIPCACRDIFLDHSNSLSDVRKRFKELVEFAQKHGWAVAIGHFRPNTITVLAEELPKLADRGIALIPMSEMVW